MQDTSRRPSAQEIVDTVADAMKNGVEPFDKEAYLVPIHFEVLLHPTAYKEIAPTFSYLNERIRARLDNELRAMNLRKNKTPLVRLVRRVNRLLGKPEPATIGTPKEVFQRTVAAWYLDILPNYDAETPLGYIGVRANLHREKTDERMNEIGHHQPTRNFPMGALNPASSNKTVPLAQPRASASLLPHAYITYEDLAGKQKYVIEKPDFAIGRLDPTSKRVDLSLQTNGEVSREHVRIRYTPEMDTFYVKDLSRFGTYINHHRLEPGYWQPLNSGDELSLAGQIHLFFYR